jgi:DNA-binding NarL/FixJ family response regulator
VLVAEDQVLVRAGYRALLNAEGGIAVVGEAGTAGEAITLAAETRPDVVLLDLEMPGLETAGATARSVSDPAFTGVAVMVTVRSWSDARVVGALGAGAVGVMAKDADPAELIGGVYALARGDALIPADVVRQLLCELLPASSRSPRPCVQRLEELTNREQTVFALLAAGLSNVEIAAHLAISPATAKTHISRMMMKLGARTRAQLVVLAYETGLVQPRSAARQVHPPSLSRG